jgi:probable rRNA maturation factor
VTAPTITAAVKLPPAAVRELSRRLRRAARRMGVPAADLAGIAVHVVDDAEITRLNLEHMGEDRPTDVLSFPARSPDAPPILPNDDDDRPTDARSPDATDEDDDDDGDAEQAPPPIGLGDIVLSWDAVRRQAGARPLLDEATVLLIHGLAHLLGHDHTGRRDGRAMHRRERRGLSAARVADIPRPYAR